MPPEFRFPLIKVPPSAGPPDDPHSLASPCTTASLHGYASGVRSALVKIQGVWYRLKGCGNNCEGFIAKCERKRIYQPGNAQLQWTEFMQIRGSAFPHTAVRELAVTGRVNAALAAIDSGTLRALGLNARL